MKFNTKAKTIFLDSASEYKEIDGKLNIVLSPSLYWVKKISLPVKYARDAIKLLPSIFEDILPDGNYSYYAYKLNDDFIVFAYNDKLILDTLADKGISLSSISNIYFAQSEIVDISTAMKINETQSIYIKDDILILVPCCWIEEKGELNLDNIKHSKHNIKLQQFGHIVDTKSLYKVGAILVMMIFLVSAEYFMQTKKINDITLLKDNVFEKYSLKSTTFQNKALLKKYTNIYKTQTKIRQYISNILKVKLDKNQHLATLSIKNKKILVSFSGVKKGSGRRIIDSFKSNGMIIKTKYLKNSLKIEVSI